MTFQDPLGKWVSFFFFFFYQSEQEPFDLGLFKFSRNYSKEHVKLIIQVYTTHLNRILLNIRLFFLKSYYLNHLIGALSPRPYCAKEIWKRIWNAFIRHKDEAFWKTLFKPEKFKNLAFRFSVDRNNFKKEAFRKRWRHDNHDIYQPEF